MLPNKTGSAMHDPLEHVNLKDQRAVDTVLAGELNKMSVQEREKIYEEIHGVEKMIPETPDFVNSRLFALEMELQRIAVKPAYNLAEKKSKEYVSSRKLRLMFLRADYFDSTKAAKRMVKFFEGKLWMFGKKPLARPILLSDLDKDDRIVLASGCYRFLRSRDRSGRLIALDLQNMFPKTWKRGLNLVRCITYMLMSALEDEETQRRGVVGIMYHMGKEVELPDSDMRNGFVTMGYLPLKITGVHLCFSNPWINAYARTLLGMCGPAYRTRTRLHTGSHTEIQYSLMTFGLPMDEFPVSAEGEANKAGVDKWIKKLKWKEKSLSNPAIQNVDRVDIPGIYDILVGKGKPFQRHSGNLRLRARVKSYLDEYISAPKGMKRLVPKKVLDIVRQEDGSRFLKKDRFGWWVEVSNEDALDKVCKLFLSIKSGSKGGHNNSTVESTVVRQGEGEKKTRIECCNGPSHPAPGMVNVDWM